MFTASDLMGPGLFTEIGGEFIDTTHEDIMGLVKEFNLELIDLHAPQAPAVRRETFFFNGRHLTEAQDFLPSYLLRHKLQIPVGHEVQFSLELFQ